VSLQNYLIVAQIDTPKMFAGFKILKFFQAIVT